jgi:nitrate/nitrite transporter NarK
LNTSAALLSPAAERRAASLIYAASFSYTISLGSMQVLVPLYGLYLGYDIKALGLILSAQAALPLFTRFFGGAIADRFGARYVLWFSFSTMLAAGMVLSLLGPVLGTDCSADPTGDVPVYLLDRHTGLRHTHQP